ncbi:MAG: metallophosphoesterase [Treponema sp.]|jgi:hypothetical protein|nr:metallophosphoesterase [Treponema sp.]
MIKRFFSFVPFLAVCCLVSCAGVLFPEYVVWNDTAEFRRENHRELVKQTGQDFKILQLSDTHIGSYIKYDFNGVRETFNMISEDVRSTQPDLIILAGDNIISSGPINTLWAERLTAFLDSLAIPYIIVMGNHDGAGLFDVRNDNRRLAVADVFTAGKYSLFSRGPDNIGGTGNYGVNIVSAGGGILYSIIVLDNAGENEYFSAGQIKWYEWYVKGISKAQYGAYAPPGQVVKSMAAFHVPLPETINLRDEMMASSDPDIRDLAAGCFREYPSLAKNTGMFQKMKDLGSTIHLLFAHDHANLLNYPYQGIYFIYGVKTGPNEANGNRLGTTLITLKDDLTVTVDFLIH